MLKAKWLQASLGLALAATLQGCGGGSDDPSRAAQPAAKDRSMVLAAEASAAVVRPLNITESTIKPTVSADQLMSWAESEYPALFPRGVQTQQLVYEQKKFALRAYQAVKTGTTTYLGVTQGGTVYGLGDFTQGQMQRLGSVESYACRVTGACSGSLKAIRRIYADAGSLQCMPDTGVSLIDTRRRLTDAGVRVGAANCSYRPVLVPAVCGASDTRIWVFEVEAADLSLVSAAIFQPIETLNVGTGNSPEYPVNVERACDY